MSLSSKQPSKKAEMHSILPKQPLGVYFQPQSMTHSHPREGGKYHYSCKKKRQETLYHGKILKYFNLGIASFKIFLYICKILLIIT